MPTTGAPGRATTGGKLGRRFAAACLASLLAGCAGVPGGPEGGLGERLVAMAGVAPAEPEEATIKAASRSIWGVVPEAPKRKADLRPELIRGSAVAISPDRLLASCRVVGGRRSVGLVRHNKYRIAQVSARDNGVCALRVAQGPLAPARGYRSVGDLRPGEPVFAFTSRTSADLALWHGTLASVAVGADPFLETTLALPPETGSAALFDAEGNLIGLGSAGPTAGSLAFAAPVTEGVAPTLARRDLGPGRSLLARLLPAVRERGGEPLLFRLAPGDDDGGDGAADTASPQVEASLDSPATSPGPVAGPAPDQEQASSPSRAGRGGGTRSGSGPKGDDQGGKSRAGRDDRGNDDRARGDRGRHGGRDDDGRGHDRGRGHGDDGDRDGGGRGGKGRGGRD